MITGFDVVLGGGGHQNNRDTIPTTKENLGILAIKFLFTMLVVLQVVAMPEDAWAVARRINICFDYGCKDQQAVVITDADITALRNLFTPIAASAASERQRVQVAISFLETLAGEQTPVYRDRGGNPYDGEFPGQLDCIDESTNTTRYLHLLQDLGLLHWHRVGQRVKRAPLLFDVHWTATLIELPGGRAYAVDSWYRDNGEPPVVQPLEQWYRKQPVKQ